MTLPYEKLERYAMKQIMAHHKGFILGLIISVARAIVWLPAFNIAFASSAIAIDTTGQITVPIYPSPQQAESTNPINEDSEIPTQPSAPPPLFQQPAPDFYRCQRLFTYKGKTLGCDSNIRLDGDKLRPILKDTPNAIDELDLYQKNRLFLRNAAYIGTFGLGIIALGLLYTTQTSNESVANAVRNASFLIGGGLIGGGVLFSISATRTNEVHLNKAVKFYNEAHPDTPIELQFNTAFHF